MTQNVSDAQLGCSFAATRTTSRLHACVANHAPRHHGFPVKNNEFAEPLDSAATFCDEGVATDRWVQPRHLHQVTLRCCGKERGACWQPQLLRQAVHDRAPVDRAHWKPQYNAACHHEEHRLSGDGPSQIREKPRAHSCLSRASAAWGQRGGVLVSFGSVLCQIGTLAKRRCPVAREALTQARQGDAENLVKGCAVQKHHLIA
mmetsp:Transcript_48962/g.113478  ORF Transcript_48962/g.113478 Transcript_48962/m.113478 type:complete len:203 (+) Transcript_48962:269-877(+)